MLNPSASLLMVALTLVLGFVLGALLAAWRGRKRSEALHIELAVLKSQAKTEEQLERERQAALDRAMEQVRSSFDAVAGASLRSNSEVFLQLAREHLGQHQQSAVAALGDQAFVRSAREHNRPEVMEAIMARLRVNM